MGNGGEGNDEGRSGGAGTVDDIKGADVYGTEIWVVMGVMLTIIEGFNHQVDRIIAGNTAWRDGDGGWEWPPVEEDLDVTGIYLIKEYIQRRQATIAAPISNHPIYELFAGA